MLRPLLPPPRFPAEREGGCKFKGLEAVRRGRGVAGLGHGKP